MSQLYTLRELWDQVGGPFDAVLEGGHGVHVVAIAPSGEALGWSERGNAGFWYTDRRCYTLATPRTRKVTLRPALWRACDGRYAISLTLFETEDAARTAYTESEFIRLLDERAVEVEVPCE